MAEKPSIKERFDILVEAIEFFSDLSDAGEDSYKLGRVKAAALSTVEGCLDLYQRTVLEDAEWTEETLAQGLELSVNEDHIEKMVNSKEMSPMEADFYKGGFGLAIGIMEGDMEQINGLRELESHYDNVVESKLNNKTIGDLLK